MVNRLVLIILFVLGFNSLAAAGWVSGGGELIEDAQNPWFFSNTAEVKYCVLIDEANFGQDIESVRQRIRIAFDYWKYQFKDVITYDESLKLATQNFVEISCDKNPDIKFQFGVLTGAQLERIRNPTQYVGLTVRTEYDKINLKGKGFVYFSPQSGPLKFELLNSENIASNWKPWTAASGTYLLPVLIHEVGHLFGLSHDDDIFLMGEREIETTLARAGNPNSAIMEQSFWEQVEKDKLYYRWNVFLPGRNNLADALLLCVSLSQTPPAPGVTPSLQNSSKDLSQTVFQKFFKFSSDEVCTNHSFNNDILTIKASTDGGVPRIVGNAKMISQPTNFNTKSMVRAWLTKEQRVFQEIGNLQPLPIAYMEKLRIYKGTFNFTDGSASRKIFMTAYSGPRQLIIGGELDGDLYVDLNSGF